MDINIVLSSKDGKRRDRTGRTARSRIGHPTFIRCYVNIIHLTSFRGQPMVLCYPDPRWATELPQLTVFAMYRIRARDFCIADK